MKRKKHVMEKSNAMRSQRTGITLLLFDNVHRVVYTHFCLQANHESSN